MQADDSVEMHVWKLSVALKELKFDEIMPVLLIKICSWFMTSMNPSTYGYMLDEVAKHERRIIVFRAPAKCKQL